MTQKWNGSGWVNEDPEKIKEQNDKDKKMELARQKLADAQTEMNELEKEILGKGPDAERIEELKEKIEQNETELEQLESGNTEV